MGCECNSNSVKYCGGEVYKGKSFNFSSWNSTKIYSNNDRIQDFVYYNGALYVYINPTESTFGHDPYDDTHCGTQTGTYWLQLFYQPECRCEDVRFRTDNSSYIQVSYDGGETYGYLLDEIGNKILVNTGPKGENGLTTKINKISADIKYNSTITEPQIVVDRTGTSISTNLVFHFVLPTSINLDAHTVTINPIPADATVEINGVITNSVTTKYGTLLNILVKKESCGSKTATYTVTKTETINIQI